MRISVGVLIVGSLYWEESVTRQAWRNERLELGLGVPVAAPIRYGRRSKTRGDSYTMVFSSELCSQPDRMGSGILVPCKHRVGGVGDLVAEAEYLWAAEQNSVKRTGQISASWGCVAVVANPNSSQLAPLLSGWADRTRIELHHGKLRQGRGERALVDANGQVAIPWPVQCDGQSVDLDAVLLTATNPTLTDGEYATPAEIASAWQTPKGSVHVNYFRNNRRHQITTYQDNEMETLLAK